MGFKYPYGFTGLQEGLEFSPTLFGKSMVEKGHDLSSIGFVQLFNPPPLIRGELNFPLIRGGGCF